MSWFVYFQNENFKLKIPKLKFQNVSVKDQHCRIIYLEGCISNISELVISFHADLLSISDHVKQAQVLSSSIPDSSSRWNHVDKLRNFTWDEISQGISSKDSKLSIYNFRTSSFFLDHVNSIDEMFIPLLLVILQNYA